MKLFKHTQAFFFFMLPVLVFSVNPKWKGKYTKEKTINKTYDVSADALLEIDNSYGNLYITTWNDNRIVIEVSIKTNGDDEDKVQDKLDDIDVAFSGTTTHVSAETLFSSNKSNWSWWSWWKGNTVNMEVNYTIKMPVTNRVDLSNDYGSINIDRLNGKAKISCDYGRLQIDELNADDNELTFDYTNNSHIGYIKSGTIHADYSSYEVEKAEQLKIKADYTSSKIGCVKTVDFNCDYGSIKIETVEERVEGEGSYAAVRLGVLSGNVRLESAYGGIKIDELAEDAKNVAIKTDYTGVKMGYNANYHFDFTLDLDYAGLKSDDGLEFNIKRNNTTSNYYEGYHGSKEKNKVTINADYGSVSFYKK